MSEPLLVARRPIGFLDVVRAPYQVDPNAPNGLVGQAGTLRWPEDAALRTASLAEYSLERTPLFTRVLDDEACSDLLGRLGGAWQREAGVYEPGGRVVGAVWRRGESDVFLPFDPDEARTSLLREAYLEVTMSGARHWALDVLQRGYYRARRLTPRSVQLALRRRYMAAQNRAEFPAWPAETALHDLDARLLQLAERAAGEPLPWIASWPDAYRWALVLTHDVETAAGLDRLEAVLAAELKRGLRSACYFVPERDYTVEAGRLDDLRRAGFEVGLHGLRHDGRDLAGDGFEERLPAMRRYAASWGADGFRSPSTHRDPERLARLGLDYDSSYSDVARFEPQPGGSCSWLPFFLGSIVELPITMPMDHLVFDLLGLESDELWATKGAFLRANGGMALLLTHPDYLLDDDRLAVYGKLLDRWSDDETVWRALPRDVASWWRERSELRLVRDGGEWRVTGSGASRARVVSGAPARPVGDASVDEGSPVDQHALGATVTAGADDS